MSGLLRISEAAVLAIHTVALLGANEGDVLTNHQIADFLGASEAHLSKVLQRLAKAGFVTSLRGPRGGFQLSRPSEEITLLEVYELIEGALVTSDCLLSAPVCGGNCILGGMIRSVSETLREKLSTTTVSDMAAIFSGR